MSQILQAPRFPVEFEPFTASDAEIAEYEAWLDRVNATLPPQEAPDDDFPIPGEFDWRAGV